MSQRMPPVDEDDIVEVPLWRQRKVLVIAAVTIGFVAVVLARGRPEPKEEPAAKASQSFIGVVVPYTSQPAVAAPPPPVPHIAELPTPPAPVAEAAFVVPMPPSINLRPTAAAPKSNSPAMMSFSAPPASPATVAGAGEQQPSQTRVTFKGADIPGSKASAAADTTYMLMPGLLPVVLDTAISSDVPAGSIIGHLLGPVYSRKGVVLMEAGTQIIGRYEGLKNGSNRIQAVSTYAITPNDIFVPLTDNMSDDLGRTGLEGNVNRRYGERFGAAIMLTLTQSILGIIQAKASQGGNTYLSLGSGGGGVGGLAEQILQSTINLPPIFSKNQGETIAIFIANPVSFQDSYKIGVKP